MKLSNTVNPPGPARRDMAALRRHFEIERELADRLRCAPASERKHLYRTVYNELFQRVPDHPQNTRKRDAAQQQALTRRQLQFIDRFLTPQTVYLEVGAGDCHLATTVASRVKHAYGVDVSDFIAQSESLPTNFQFVLSDGITIDVPAGSVDVAFSHQLMEHLHPDDATAQLAQIFRALKPGGIYVCITPHRYSGPQDVSQYFTTEASGFHLKEYTYGELRKIFSSVGFASTAVWVPVKGRYLSPPERSFVLAERLFSLTPKGARRKLAKSMPLRPLFTHVHIVGRKPHLSAAAEARVEQK